MIAHRFNCSIGDAVYQPHTTTYVPALSTYVEDEKILMIPLESTAMDPGVLSGVSVTDFDIAIPDRAPLLP